MKPLFILLFVLIQAMSFAQSNLVADLYANGRLVSVYKGDILFTGNTAGTYDAEFKFIPTATQAVTLTNYYYTGTQCTVKLRLTGNISQSSGVISLRKDAVYYYVTVKGVSLSALKIYNNTYNVWLI